MSELRVKYPPGGLYPDYSSVEYVIDPALESIGNYVATDTLAGQPNLTQGQRIVLAIHACYCEVANGGFHQFFRNSGPELTFAALEGFMVAEMVREDSLLRNAIQLVPGGLASGNGPHFRARLDQIDYQDWRRKVEPLEKQWFDGEDSMSELVAFIESRPQDFFSTVRE